MPVRAGLCRISAWPPEPRHADAGLQPLCMTLLCIGGQGRLSAPLGTVENRTTWSAPGLKSSPAWATYHPFGLTPKGERAFGPYAYMYRLTFSGRCRRCARLCLERPEGRDLVQ